MLLCTIGVKGFKNRNEKYNLHNYYDVISSVNSLLDIRSHHPPLPKYPGGGVKLFLGMTHTYLDIVSVVYCYLG